MDADALPDAELNMSESFLGMKIISPPADVILQDGDHLQLGSVGLKSFTPRTLQAESASIRPIRKLRSFSVGDLILPMAASAGPTCPSLRPPSFTRVSRNSSECFPMKPLFTQDMGHQPQSAKNDPVSKGFSDILLKRRERNNSPEKQNRPSRKWGKRGISPTFMTRSELKEYTGETD